MIHYLWGKMSVCFCIIPFLSIYSNVKRMIMWCMMFWCSEYDRAVHGSQLHGAAALWNLSREFPERRWIVNSILLKIFSWGFAIYINLYESESVNHSVVSDSLQPHGLWPEGSFSHGILQARMCNLYCLVFCSLKL